MSKNVLDKIALQLGSVYDEKAEQKVPVNVIMDNLMIDTAAPTYEFENEGVIPGSEVKMPLVNTEAEITEEDKNAANDKLMNIIAMEKIEKEKAAVRKLSDDEKVKWAVIHDTIAYQQQMYFNQHGYQMDGAMKRRLRKNVERAWAKGKLRPNRKQREEILYNINLASQTDKPTQPAETMTTSGTPVGNDMDLKSLMI